jgi:hypothetical protein
MKIFKASIPASTLERRAHRIRTNVRNKETHKNHSKNLEKPNNQEVKPRKQEPGPGRPGKYAKSPDPGVSDIDPDPSSSQT